jgi:hypothetical protein
MIPFSQLFTDGAWYVLPDGTQVRAEFLRITAPNKDLVMLHDSPVFVCANEPFTQACWYFYSATNELLYSVDEDHRVTSSRRDKLSVEDFRAK